MEKKLFLTMVAAAFMLASCGNEENEVKESWNGEIRLSSSIEAQTRATHGLDKVLKAGESVHVWVDDSKSPTTSVTTENLYKNNVLTVGDAGALSVATGKDMYFPQSGNTVNIYALHTNATLTGDEFPGELTHTVAQDQKAATATAGAGYQGSDLVYAKIAGQARTADAISLTFTHMLSKIEVVLVKGAGVSDITSAEILNTKLKAVFTPSKTTAFSVATDAAETIPADFNPIAIDCGTTLQADANGSDDTKITLNEAIIVPQTLAKETAFIRINENLTYKLPAEKTFIAGKKYRYIVTANLSGLTVTSSITDWSPETGDNNGSASM